MSNRLLEGIKDGEQLKIAAAGAWIAENARNLGGPDRRRNAARRHHYAASTSIWVVSNGSDTFGAWLLERLVRAFSARGCETKITGLKEDYRALVDEVRGVKPEAKSSAALAMPWRISSRRWA